MPITLPHEWVKIHAGADPEAPAVVFADATISYGELLRSATRRARQLISEGAGPGVLVSFDASSSPATIVELVAVHMAGAVAVPRGPQAIDGSAPVEATAYVVVATSGSSGRPRGVILTKSNIAAATEASHRRLSNRAADRWLLTLPLFHIGALSVVWRSLVAGGSVELLPRFETDAAITALRSGSVTFASLVPTMLHRLLAADAGPYDGLTAVLLGGAPASIDLVERALDAGLPILQTYGMTEAGSQVATVEPGTARAALGTAGPPLDGVELSIDDGEILVDGATVSPGYLGGHPRVGPHRTGDLGYLDDQGRLVVTGRRDTVIITGGENVHPATIEAAIESLPIARRAVAVGVADDEWGQIVVAVVEAAPADLPAIEMAVRRLVARHEVPRRWIAVDEVPQLETGKPDRAAARTLATG